VAPAAANAVAVICGPPVMIRFTLPTMIKLGFGKEQIYTSLENRMKCGIGKCGRCNVGPKYVCLDGPVFSMAELDALPAEY
jgi:NAD(P)H-flavin reductase